MLLALLGSVGCTTEIGATDSGELGPDGVSPGGGAQPGAGSTNGTAGTRNNGFGGGSGSTTSQPGGGTNAGPGPGPGPGPGNPGGGNGSVGSAGQGTGSGTAGSGTVTPVDMPPVACGTPGPRMIRRLSSKQYRNTLVDIFADPAVPDGEIFADPAVLGFRNDADAAVVEGLNAELLMNYTETVAAWAVTNNKLSRFTNGCNSNDSSCQETFIRNLGKRVMREPVSATALAQYKDLMSKEASFNEAAEVVITAMLQSPYTLYRREMGTQAGNEYTLTPFEVASQLSYFLTESPPDDMLLQAAEQGRLSTPADLDAQVERLLKENRDGRAHAALGHFVQGWLEIDDLPMRSKADATKFDATIAQAMQHETEALFLDTLLEGKTVSDLLTANYTFVNQKLAQLYGLPGGGGDTFTRVDLTGTKRASGILGQGAFLAMHAMPDFPSPVQRGLMVRERLLCQDLPPVPADLNTNLDRETTFRNNRERYQQHSSDPVCAGCHRMMDPVGFAFEDYDQYGTHREEDGGTPVDATGVLSMSGADDVPLDGLQSLIDYLAQSDVVRSCLVRYWTYYAHGRDEWAQKQCNHDSIRTEAGSKNYTLRSVLNGIVHAPHFTRRVKDQ